MAFFRIKLPPHYHIAHREKEGTDNTCDFLSGRIKLIFTKISSQIYRLSERLLMSFFLHRTGNLNLWHEQSILSFQKERGQVTQQSQNEYCVKFEYVWRKYQGFHSIVPELVRQQHTLSLLRVGYFEGQVSDVCICHTCYRTQLNEGGLAERKLPEISLIGELYSKFAITYIVVTQIREVAGLFSMLLTWLVYKIIHCR